VEGWGGQEDTSREGGGGLRGKHVGERHGKGERRDPVNLEREWSRTWKNPFATLNSLRERRAMFYGRGGVFWAKWTREGGKKNKGKGRGDSAQIRRVGDGMQVDLECARNQSAEKDGWEPRGCEDVRKGEGETRGGVRESGCVKKREAIGRCCWLILARNAEEGNGNAGNGGGVEAPLSLAECIRVEGSGEKNYVKGYEKRKNV